METLTPFVTWLRARDRSPRTIRSYATSLKQFATWFRQSTGQELSPAVLTPLDVREYRQHLQTVRRLAPATINTYLAGVRAYAAWAQETGRTAHDPTAGIKGVRQVAAAPRWLSRTEQYALLRQVAEAVQLGDLRAGDDPTAPGHVWPRRDAALISLLLNTGLRLSEAAALQVGDLEIHPRSGEVTVRSGKGRKARAVPLNRDVRQALEAWLEVRPEEDTPALFLSQKGGALSPRAIGSRVTRLAERAGLEDVSPHTLRHSFAKNLVDAGVTLEKVATLLGHESLETTRVYITPSQADLQAATEKVAWRD